MTLVLAAALGLGAALRAQETAKTVADGVFTEAQASRGAASYTTSCSGCHRADMGGMTGPPLKEERFAKDFAGKPLNDLFIRIASTMPRNAPATLADDMYLDILAHILQENGFQAGKEELKADLLSDIRIVPGRPKPPPQIGDFSYVETVGCLTAGPNGSWLLTHAVEPTVVVLPASADQASRVAQATAGTNTFHLIDAMAYGPEAHKGQKIYVRGLVIRLPSEQRMTISALEMLSVSCRQD